MFSFHVFILFILLRQSTKTSIRSSHRGIDRVPCIRQRQGDLLRTFVSVENDWFQRDAVTFLLRANDALERD